MVKCDRTFITMIIVVLGICGLMTFLAFFPFSGNAQTVRQLDDLSREEQVQIMKECYEDAMKVENLSYVESATITRCF